MFKESEHPRDSDGKFTDKNTTPAEHKRLVEMGVESEQEYVQELHNRLTDTKWEKSLDKNTKESIKNYTIYSNKINNLLRNNRSDWDTFTQKQVSAIDDAIDKYNLKEPIIVYRRVPQKFVKRDILKENSFSSSSISKEQALKMVKTENKDVVYVYDLTPNVGLGAYINNLADENHKDIEFEFLIGRNISFKEVDNYEEDGVNFIKWRLKDG